MDSWAGVMMEESARNSSSWSVCQWSGRSRVWESWPTVRMVRRDLLVIAAVCSSMLTIFGSETLACVDQ